MSIVIAVVGALLGIFAVVVIHEFGHFIVARAFGIHIKRFSIGFGRALCTRQSRRGTQYTLGWLPLGGYVEMQTGVGPQSFEQKACWVRALVIIAGPVMNIVLAVLVLWIVLSMGVQRAKPIVGHVQAQSIAASEGLRAGDRILRVGDRATPNWRAVVLGLIEHSDTAGRIPIQLQTKQATATRIHYLPAAVLTKPKQHFDLLANLGIKPYRPPIVYTLPATPTQAVQQTWQLLRLNVVVLWKLLSGQLSFEWVGGPISIAHTAAQASQSGWQVYLGFIAFISLTLGFVNILPIPVLDGGHLLFLGIEALRRRPLSLQVQAICQRLGLSFLALLIIFASYNDIVRIFGF